MSDDRFRTETWELSPAKGCPTRVTAEMRKDADARLAAEGWVPLVQHNVDLTDFSTHPHGVRFFTVRLYERRPPTVREAGDAIVAYLEGGPRDWNEEELLVTAWRDAVERA